MTAAEHDRARQAALAFSDRHWDLLRKAVPDTADTALFDRLMAEAKALGLAWMDGLEYVIRERRTMLN